MHPTRLAGLVVGHVCLDIESTRWTASSPILSDTITTGTYSYVPLFYFYRYTVFMGQGVAVSDL